SGISGKRGWWTSIAPGDFDNDGNVDYILGNTGQNTFYRVSEKYPGRIYAKDFDKNGVYDAIPTLYLKDKEGKRKEFAAHTRDDLIKQINSMRLRFPFYHAFANATADSMLTKEDRRDALVLEANTMQSVLLRNKGNGTFDLVPLPVQAQLSTIDGMVVDDFNGDGNLDVVMNTNDFGTDVSVGRYDALNGLLLLGNGNGNFTPLSIAKSGIFIPGNGKAMVKLNGAGNRPLMVAAQNRGALKVYATAKPLRLVSAGPSDASALVKLKNGKMQKQEFYYGSSFLSQSARFLQVAEDVQNVEITDTKGKKRTVSLK
ncbi:MAG TPA: VCBS repeat-containing protein, partial [Flavisolibacter sp.]|nr:VCBS repeat-containing protein [Flavisolibacter sp.]